MVSIVQHVHEITVERMDVVQLGEAVDDGSQLFVQGRLHKFDLAHVEFANTRNVEACGDHGRCLALSLRQTDVHQLGRVRDLLDLLKVVAHRVVV